VLAVVPRIDDWLLAPQEEGLLFHLCPPHKQTNHNRRR
jgi:hypothetical protein